MRLFFPVKGRTNIEYELQGDSWKLIPFGSYTLQIINTMLDSKESKMLIEMTGAKSEEAAIRAVQPIISLAGSLKAGRDYNFVESIGLFNIDKFEDRDLLPFFTGQDSILWEQWLSVAPLPSLIQNGRFGWQCDCGTVAEAAIVEMTFGFFCGWKGRFRFCGKCQILYHGKDCPRCMPELKEKKKFHGLLRQHKNRFRNDVSKLKIGSNRRDELEAAISVIESLLKKLQSGASLRTLLIEYKELCGLYHLPQRWTKNYNKGRAKSWQVQDHLKNVETKPGDLLPVVE